MDWQKASAELAKKLDPKHVHPPKQFGPKGSYLEGWHCMAEANRIFGFDGWSYYVMDCKPVSESPRSIGKDKKPGFGVTYVAKVRVMVDGVLREDVGAGHGYDADLGLAHESAIKEAVTDALKRALRGFGSPFGLALYDKSRENVGVQEPTADEAKVSLMAAQTLADLQRIFRALYQNHRAVADDPEVIAAKDVRKMALIEADQHA